MPMLTPKEIPPLSRATVAATILIFITTAPWAVTALAIMGAGRATYDLADATGYEELRGQGFMTYLMGGVILMCSAFVLVVASRLRRRSHRARAVILSMFSVFLLGTMTMLIATIVFAPDVLWWPAAATLANVGVIVLLSRPSAAAEFKAAEYLDYDRRYQKSLKKRERRGR